ncbi:MAG: carbamoyltransferase HypF, partial [Isosphaeraceae bacterium]
MERRSIVVSGIVQGVGFRPFVHGLASRLGLSGFVRNQSGVVLIEVEGETALLDSFLVNLRTTPPPLARVRDVTWERRTPRGGSLFRIELSEADRAGQVFVSPDVATCQECLSELFDPSDRRYHYPFINCTHCGPRLTIITGFPYDRERTTMTSFAMCNACAAEYHDPANRRFHAQPTACPECGPRIEAVDATGQHIETSVPLAHFVSALRAGKIGALKGLGGYHLVCDATSETAVAGLRQRKHRDEKPFAIMVPDLAAAERFCQIYPDERLLLQSPAAPIVLLRKKSGARIAEGIAPRNPNLGVMLPYTPIHHMLVREMNGTPLVMTSGNRSDEPIAFRDDSVERLRGIADLFLTHNRPIHVRCDDSVTRVVDGQELPIRRSRGYAPLPIDLPRRCPRPILALGGQLKATFALGRDKEAVLSHHMGDLDHYEACKEFEKDVRLYQQLFDVVPQTIVHDLHPDYRTTRLAREHARRGGCALLAVQHHHAHMASCMAENGLDETVIGVTFDGTGFGTDGAIWGGEFLLGDYRSFRRWGHLRYVGMPGGEQAIRQPWRMAVAHLVDAHEPIAHVAASRLQGEVSLIERMLIRRVNTPPTSSMGRLFDAVAALAGVRDDVSYEGQAAMELEWLAMRAVADGVYPFGLDTPHDGDRTESPVIIDTRPLIRAVVADVEKGTAPKRIARRFHTTVVQLVAAVCARIRDAAGLDAVVLSGGVFLNSVLTHEVCDRLQGGGFRVFRH